MTVVAVAMELTNTARTRLSDELGPGYVVLDLGSAPSTADVVLTPATSHSYSDTYSRNSRRPCRHC